MPRFNIKQIKGATSGSVLFLDTNGSISENNGKLFWSNSNTALFVGTSSQYGSEKFRVVGDQRIDGSSAIIGTASFTTLIGSGNRLIQTDANGVISPTYSTVSGSQFQIEYIIDGLGSVISTGGLISKRVVGDFTITGWEIFEVSDVPVPSSIVIDCWMQSYASYPATSSQTIFTGSSSAQLPTLTSATKNSNLSLSNPILCTGDYEIKINVNSCTSALKVKLVLIGATGSQGGQGSQGIQGPTGPAGSNGATGSQGIQGPTGSGNFANIMAITSLRI